MINDFNLEDCIRKMGIDSIWIFSEIYMLTNSSHVRLVITYSLIM